MNEKNYRKEMFVFFQFMQYIFVRNVSAIILTLIKITTAPLI